MTIIVQHDTILTMDNQPLKADLVSDLRTLQNLYPDYRITRNFYRAHGTYTESQWQYYFPTFRVFLATVHDEDPRSCGKHLEDLLPDNWADIYPYNVGDVILVGGTRLRVTAKGPAVLRTKRQYWYHDLLDWLSSLRKQ